MAIFMAEDEELHRVPENADKMCVMAGHQIRLRRMGGAMNGIGREQIKKTNAGFRRLQPLADDAVPVSGKVEVPVFGLGDRKADSGDLGEKVGKAHDAVIDEDQVIGRVVDIRRDAIDAARLQGAEDRLFGQGNAQPLAGLFDLPLHLLQPEVRERIFIPAERACAEARLHLLAPGLQGKAGHARRLHHLMKMNEEAFGKLGIGCARLHAGQPGMGAGVNFLQVFKVSDNLSPIRLAGRARGRWTPFAL